MHSGRIEHIAPTSGLIDPMVYPSIFPNGERGWSLDFKKRTGVTMLEYCAYRLAVRTGFSLLHRSRKLFHQLIVDWYLRVEAETLRFLQMNQDKLRVDSYKGLQDYITNDDKTLPPGAPCVLSSSFYGSPRSLQQHYQDAMCLVREFGKPDLFITFTCNPKWPEITRDIGDTGTATDRPDVVEHVFNLKLKVSP